MNCADARLLVVDDDLLVRRCLSRVLRRQGFERIDQAEDGAEAFSRFLERPYDVVITDWKMPRATGLDLLHLIRSNGERHLTPVLVLTAEDTAEHELEARWGGANGFFAKPHAVLSLAVEVKRLLQAAPAGPGHTDCTPGGHVSQPPPHAASSAAHRPR